MHHTHGKVRKASNVKNCLIVSTVIIVALIVLGGCLMLFSKAEVFNAENLSDCTVSYMSNDVLVTKKIEMADEQTILNILNGNKLFKENLSCGFSECASMNFNNNAVTIYFAQDGCGYVYSVNDKKYITINETEKKTLFDILLKYGMSFPCV
jgi:hypothetical protein